MENGHLIVKMKRQNVALMGIISWCFQRFSALQTFCFALEPKVSFADEGLYHIDVTFHVIRCRLTRLPGGHEKHKFKDPRTCVITSNKMFHIHTKHDDEIRA